MNTNLHTATLAGGCFWCLEAVYDEIKGVHGVESGYAGGHVDNPTYRQVCNGDTGHAEVVQVHFDPNVVSYRDLLNVFFAIHDPTTLNRQGADVGTQYRSAIFYHNDDQKMVAESLIEELNSQKIWDNPSSPRWPRSTGSTWQRITIRNTSRATRTSRIVRQSSRRRCPSFASISSRC
jgi:peptide-methionine (S)-S-oxide reductase